MPIHYMLFACFPRQHDKAPNTSPSPAMVEQPPNTWEGAVSFLSGSVPEETAVFLAIQDPNKHSAAVPLIFALGTTKHSYSVRNL